MGRAAGGLGDLRQTGDTRQAGVHQPVAHSRGGQEQPGQFQLGAGGAPFPIGPRRGVRRQFQQRCTLGAHRETELGVEAGVELGQRFGVGLVETVLEA